MLEAAIEAKHQMKFEPAAAEATQLAVIQNYNGSSFEYGEVREIPIELGKRTGLADRDCAEF